MQYKCSCTFQSRHTILSSCKITSSYESVLVRLFNSSLAGFIKLKVKYAFFFFFFVFRNAKVLITMDLVGQCGKKTVPRLSQDLWHEQCILEGSSKVSSSANTDWKTQALHTEPHQCLEEMKPLDLLDTLVLLASLTSCYTVISHCIVPPTLGFLPFRNLLFNIDCPYSAPTKICKDIISLQIFSGCRKLSVSILPLLVIKQC